VVKHISDRVMVLYLGRTMDVASSRELFDHVAHPYTQALLSAVPIPDPAKERAKKIIPLDGDLPSPMAPPSGCVFRTRCPIAIARCTDEVPALLGGSHQVACHRAQVPA
jgi:oligopeptide transport system ATP-binding protein